MLSPMAPASVLMIVWGRSSDRTNERRWHTALTLFMIAAGVFAAFINLSLPITIVILSTILIGAYSAKGPFWALASGWMSSTSAAAGLAAIGAIANLIGGVVMVNAYGVISEQTGKPYAGDATTGWLVPGRRYRGADHGTPLLAACRSGKKPVTH